MNLSRCCALDIETNDLFDKLVDYSSFPYKLRNDASLWCVVITNVATKESVKLIKEEITADSLKVALKDYDVIIAHNGIKFDFPVLKLFGVFDYEIGYLNNSDRLFGRDVWFVDSLIWSRLFNPDRFGGHSLEEWGKRLGEYKTDFRAKCIEAGIISKDSPKASEFKVYSDTMVDYCCQDTIVNVEIFLELLNEYNSYGRWKIPSKMEHKLADLGNNREHLGFWFDKDLALKCVEDLTEKIQTIADKINPILPPKKLTKTKLNDFTPPATQLKKDGTPSSHMLNFAKKHKAEIEKFDESYIFKTEGQIINIPFTAPLKTHEPSVIEDFDQVKMYLIDEYGWEPTEWRMRDLSKDSKKQKITLDKSIKALDKWYVDTMEGKYTKNRLEELGYKITEYDKMYHDIRKALECGKPFLIPTSPSIRVGVEKELCPNLIALGEKVEFAKDFALFLTYRHRKSCIAGGNLDDVDLTEQEPEKGYLSNYREVDGRIPTPAIELGASSGRYRHIGVSNIARTSSIYGKEMRSLFGCGKDFVQLGFDFSSLEARVQAGYVINYEGGAELAESLIAEKPNDIHSVNSRKLGIERTIVKSVAYAILYGASASKLKKMLGYTIEQAKNFYEDYWNAVPALRDFKKAVETFWETKANKLWLPGADGRKLVTRSKHSLLNALFQSCGVISAKYTTLFMFEEFENKGLCISPFDGKPDVCSMIEYHDENQLAINPKLLKFNIFPTEEEVEKFVKNWNRDEGQISAIGHSDKGYYVTLPNIVSTTIAKSIKRAEKVTKLKVDLGFEWITGRNWAQCH